MKRLLITCLLILTFVGVAYAGPWSGGGGGGSSAWTSITGFPAGCTNQFIRANGVTNTCASVSLTADVSGILPMANGGTAVALTDPNANVLLGWDDTDNAMHFIVLGTNLSYDHTAHTINATGGGSQTPWASDIAAMGYNLTGLNSLYLTSTTSSSTGIIYKSSVPFIHDFALPGTTGRNTFIGLNAGNFTMTGSTGQDGSFNVGIGYATLQNTTTGGGNVAVGYISQQYTTTGSANTSIGTDALYTNTTGHNNAAFGQQSLFLNTIGYSNIAVGTSSIANNIDGNYNTGIGSNALNANMHGSNNVAIGGLALRNETGDDNVGIGLDSLYSHAGSDTSCFGFGCFYNLTSGNNNIAIGSAAASYQADGSTPLLTAANSVYIGASSRGFNDSDSNSIVIGYNAIGIGANTVVLGNDNITRTALKGLIQTPDKVTTHLTSGYPILTSCGTSPTLTTGSSNHAGSVTIGATGTGCIITFGTAYTNAPSCVVTARTLANMTSYTVVNSAITVVGLPGIFDYNCTGLNE